MSEETPQEEQEDLSRIGHWDLSYICSIMAEYAPKETLEMPNVPRKMISRNEYRVVKQDKFENGVLGKYDFANKGITFYALNEMPKKRSFVAEDANEYAKNNPLAQYSIWLHELGHYADDKYHNIGTENTPTNTARFDRFTERKSMAIQYLAIADKYTRMKQEGIKTFVYDEHEIPLEDTLKMCPGLKEVFDKYGTNIDDKATSRAIVEASEKFFENYRQAYDEQSYKRYCRSYERQKSMPTSVRLDMARNEEQTYQTTVDDILKKVNIGERYIDLTHCKDLIDTMSAKDVETLVSAKGDEKYPYISSEQFLAVYDYLNEKGITSRSDQEMFLVENFYAITQKDSNADLGFRDVLLKTSPENKTIIYEDGTKEDFAVLAQTEEKNKKTLLGGQLKKEAKASSEVLETQKAELKQTSQVSSQENDQAAVFVKDGQVR